MSASACVAYIGLRFEVAPDEIEALENQKDNRQASARSAGLTSYWANFGGDAERYLLLIGTQIGILGPENASSVQLLDQNLTAILSDVSAKLEAAGIMGSVSLHLEWLKDA
ncbi:hypothetical protein J2Y58_004055 [Sphingomonas sp. BE138]|uniref:hypothetical protein n=1 Tax=Sphingomonas sp. BE138 TaxID=2817845 RepID=UPI0028654D9E|nr:hypothetical protein [Sphingomonas sp. BE138]MDR6790672.1 hypothetical protein [Sphingomonas sp. BE138]